MVITTFILYSILLLYGFALYASVRSAWERLSVWVKLAYAPVIIVFGIADVLYDTLFGTILYFELPGWLAGRMTFSQRCEHHMDSEGRRGSIARSFCHILNAIMPGHCQSRLSPQPKTA